MKLLNSQITNIATILLVVPLISAQVSSSLTRVTSDSTFYTNSTSFIILKCENTKWSSNNTVLFYQGEDVIFTSANIKKYSKITSLHGNDNQSIRLKPRNHDGLARLKCGVSGGRKSKSLSIPFVSKPHLSIRPSKYELGVPTIFSCNYRMSSDEIGKPTIHFYYNVQDQAPLSLVSLDTNGRDNHQTNSKNVVWEIVNQVNDRSINVTSNSTQSLGHFSCSLEFSKQPEIFSNIISTLNESLSDIPGGNSGGVSHSSPLRWWITLTFSLFCVTSLSALFQSIL